MVACTMTGERVMSGNRIPEISFGAGRGQVKLKGKESIDAGGWALRLLFVARAVAYVVTPGAVLYVTLRHFFITVTP